MKRPMEWPEPPAESDAVVQSALIRPLSALVNGEKKMSMRNRTLATYLGAALAAAATTTMDTSGNIIDDFYEENPPQKEEPQRTRYGGQKERERRAKRLAASKGA